MKILLTARRFSPPLIGGVDVYAERLGRALTEMGHEISILALHSAGDSSTIQIVERAQPPYRVWRLTFDAQQRPKQVFDQAYDPDMGAAVRQILAREQPDLFIILNFYMLSLAAVEAAAARGIPVAHIATDFVPICRRATFIRWHGRSCDVGESVQTCAACFVSHRPQGRVAASVLGRLPESLITRWADNRHAYRAPHPFRLLKPYWEQAALMQGRLRRLQPLRHQIAAVFAPTRFTAQMFIQNGFRPDQVYLLPFGVERDNSLERIRRVPAAHVRFLFMGRLQPYKGAHVLVQAFNHLHNPQNATLTIYGKQDGYPEYFDDLMAAIQTNERIRFAGSIPPSELGNAFANADYFVLPSTWHENSPLILLDALQSGTPVIASDIGGVRDAVQDGVNGFLFEMGNVAALQRVLQRVIDTPSLRERLESNIRLPSIQEYAHTMLRLCREKMNLPHPARMEEKT